MKSKYINIRSAVRTCNWLFANIKKEQSILEENGEMEVIEGESREDGRGIERLSE